jgi:hypothetical protein
MHPIPAAPLGLASSASLFHLPAAFSAVDPEMPGLLVLAGFLALTGLLIYLWLTVRQLRAAVRLLEGRLESPAPAPVQAPAAARVSPEPEMIDEGVLTAIAAAVATIFKQPHRIVAVQPDAGAQLAWSSEGRRELYHSHRIR